MGITFNVGCVEKTNSLVIDRTYKIRDKSDIDRIRRIMSNRRHSSAKPIAEYNKEMLAETKKMKKKLRTLIIGAQNDEHWMNRRVAQKMKVVEGDSYQMKAISNEDKLELKNDFCSLFDGLYDGYYILEESFDEKLNTSVSNKKKLNALIPLIENYEGSINIGMMNLLKPSTRSEFFAEICKPTKNMIRRIFRIYLTIASFDGDDDAQKEVKTLKKKFHSIDHSFLKRFKFTRYKSEGPPSPEQ